MARFAVRTGRRQGLSGPSCPPSEYVRGSCARGQRRGSPPRLSLTLASVPRQAQARSQRAEELKAEAERQLNVDSQQSLAIADQIFSLGEEADIRGLGMLARADALRELGRYAEAAQ